MCRIASAAAARNCQRLFQPFTRYVSTRRIYASWTSAVACSVCPGDSSDIRWEATRRSSSYTSGSNRSAADGSPDSIWDRIRVTSVMLSKIPCGEIRIHCAARWRSSGCDGFLCYPANEVSTPVSSFCHSQNRVTRSIRCRMVESGRVRCRLRRHPTPGECLSNPPSLKTAETAVPGPS